MATTKTDRLAAERVLKRAVTKARHRLAGAHHELEFITATEANLITLEAGLAVAEMLLDDDKAAA